jgi:DNA repair protein RecN (Recombination protein N)
MIRFLSIRDLAIVDALDLEFEEGFNVLTGETGAGKSIIMGALGLLVGGRGGGDLVRTGMARARVQATLEDPAGTETIVRREIAAQGRGRIFLNDELSTAAALKTLGAGLVDMHGQHEHQALLDPRSHVGLLDAYGGLESGAAAVAAAYARWQEAKVSVETARTDEEELAARVEFLEFQLQEIDRVAPQPGEDEALRQERSRLANADRLLTLAGSAYARLYEQDDSVLSSLGVVWRQLEELAALDAGLAEQVTARDAVVPLLEDLAHALRSYAAAVEVSPARLAEVEARLADIERLVRKHGGTLDAVLDRRRAIAAQVQDLSDREKRRTTLETHAVEAREAYIAAATALSSGRIDRARQLAPALEAELRHLAMPNARVEVDVDAGLPEGRWGPRGTDRVELLLSANPGEETRPLARVASGGELSRVMLALKTLVATDVEGKTLVFDEVDAGIGGRAADHVGQRLRALGSRYQVLCVTHAPQLAAHATAHFRVSKRVDEGRTYTAVERLTQEERVAELARLMTGSDSSTARASASEMLESRHTAAAGTAAGRGNDGE